MMEIEELKNLIRLGESETLEFKKSLSAQNDALKTASAFANGAGGWILFGVRDDGEITGLTIGSNTLENLAQAFQQSTDPVIYPSLTTVAISGKTVLAVHVPEGSDKPYTFNGMAYKRVGRSTQPLRRSEYERLLLEKHANGYETLPAVGARWQELEQERIESFLSARAPRAAGAGAEVAARAVTEKLATRSGNELVPTITGWLAFSTNPQTLNPAWGITALVFRGNVFQREALVLRQDLIGSASALIEAAVTFVSRNMRIFPVLPEGQTRRIDFPEYDLTAVREAAANAVAHRDYRAHEPIQLRMFEDRLELQNPGPLSGDLTIDQVTAGGVTRARNPVLAQILLAQGYMERAGFGLAFIKQKMLQLGAPPPNFESDLAHFLVRLWARPHPGAEHDA